MNLTKNFPLPEFVLLDGDNHKGDELESRTVVLHIPSQTYLEVVAAEPEDVNKFKSVQHFPFVFTNIDGEDETFLFLLHQTANEAGLPDLFVKAAQWYGTYANWLDNEINNL